MTTDTPETLLDLDGYAARQGVSTRTIRRWLDAGEIPGAVKIAGKWAIPADAIRQVAQDALVPTSPSRAPARQPATVVTVLDTQPVFLDLETASQLLGITVHALKAHPDYFALVRYGHRGAWVMPKYRVHQLNGTEAR